MRRKAQSRVNTQPAADVVTPAAAVVAQTVVAQATSPLSDQQTKKVVKELLEDGWPIRRRVMFAALAFIAVNVQYQIVWGKDTALNSTIATNLLWVGGGIIGAYVFGAVWDDMNRRDTMLQYDTSYGTPTPFDPGGE